jgi:ribosomal protein S18 acetylase RimI-like enzyme
MNIRPFDFSETDYEAVVNIHNTSFPENTSSLEAWKQSDASRDPKYFYQRLVAEEENGAIVGTVSMEEPHWTYKVGKFFIYVAVHPEHRQQGFGAGLYDAALEILTEKQPSMMTSEAREDQPDAMKFLGNRGFQTVQREPISRLDVPSFDASPFRKSLSRFEASGLQVHTVSELLNIDPDCWPKVHELDAKIMADVPMPEPFTPLELEQFVKETADPIRGFNADAWFIAVVPSVEGVGEYVGLSCLWNDTTNPAKMYTGLTGVLRSHRRKGVATTLKIRGINYASRQSATVIETNNEENNPMFQLNVALGFREVTAFLEYEKRLS